MDSIDSQEVHFAATIRHFGQGVDLKMVQKCLFWVKIQGFSVEIPARLYTKSPKMIKNGTLVTLMHCYTNGLVKKQLLIKLNFCHKK